MNNEYIYIVLVKALTGLGQFSRMITKYEYSHIAVCLDEKLEDFVTFSRRKHYSPFNAGFMHEKREHYAFGENKKVKVKVFKVPVTKENKARITDYIADIEDDKEYVFNIYSMITMPFIHGFKIYKAHNCMSFTAKIIELSDCVQMDKPYYKYNIPEMDELLSKFKYKEGYLKKKQEDYEYMQKESVVCNVKRFVELNGKLMGRMFWK
ncbi:MAG: hypothetical protein J6L69_09510 [Lachnospiraceae bacterium]|nr:hypothetical protein [Lachnospiraceae bacterium]